MGQEYPLPTVWADLEEMCYRLVAAEGKLSAPFRYGRQGQRQNGVDIAGMRTSSRSEWEGFQCKLKGEHLEKNQLSENEIIEEIDKAQNFRPLLRQYTFVTTAPRDKTSRDLIDRINSSASRPPFELDVWYWGDIEGRLNNAPEVARRFYPQYFPEDHVTTLQSGAIESHFYVDQSSEKRSQRFNRFASHRIFSPFGPVTSQILSVVPEVVENALHAQKGRATRVTVEFDGAELRISDNGVPYDPTAVEVLSASQRGVKAIQGLKNIPGAGVSYLGRNDEIGTGSNVLTIPFPPRLLANESFRTCVAYSDPGVLYDRSTAFDAAAKLVIPDSCDPFIVRLSDGVASHSSTDEFVRSLRRRLGQRGLRVIVPAHRSDLFEVLRDMAGSSNFELLQD